MPDALLDLHPDERRRPKRPEGVRKDFGQIGLSFEERVLSMPTRHLMGMCHGEDPFESQIAAATVLPHLSIVQALVLAAIREAGTAGLTAKEAEDMTRYVPEFQPYAMNTIRRRFTDLKKMGAIVQRGEDAREGCAVWIVK